jgi:hypothetical protein
MNNQLPRGIKSGTGWLRLPEFQVERPVHLIQLAPAFNEIFSHTRFIT